MRIFSLYIHSSKSATPTLAFEIASDEKTVQTMVERALAESRDGLLAEVREEDRLLFTLDRDGGLFRSPHVERQLRDVA